MVVLTGMLAGAMVFSSFAAPKQELKCESSETIMNDDGWEDWTTVSAHSYVRCYNRDGWCRGQLDYDKVQIQRRAWCGNVQYRALLNGTPYSVTKSPTEDYPYCFYRGDQAFCFYM